MTDRVYVRDQRRRNFFMTDNVIVDEGYGAIVGPSGLGVYLVLSRRANNKTSAAVVTHRSLCRDTGIKSRVTLRKELQKLRDAGLILIEQRFDGAGQMANEYVLLDVNPDPGQNLEGGSNLVPGGGTNFIPTPGTNFIPGPGTKVDHFKKDSVNKDLRGEKGSRPKKTQRMPMERIVQLVRLVQDQHANGWTVAELIETGKLDAADWREVRRSSYAKSQGVSEWR